AAAQVPGMQPVAVFAAEQQFRHQTVLEHVRRAPFAGDLYVVGEMPGEVVGEKLRTTIDLPPPQHIVTVVIERKYAPRAVPIGGSETVHIKALGAAVHGMETRIARAPEHFLRLDDLDDLRMTGIWLDVKDVDTRGAQAGHDQVPPLDMRMRRIGAQR